MYLSPVNTLKPLMLMWKECDLANLMVGRQVNLDLEKTEACPGDVVFEIENLNVKNEQFNMQSKIYHKIRKGEILGIAGIDGNGQKRTC